MAEIIPILSERKFTEEEAENLLPTVKRMTIQAAAEASRLEEEMRFIPREEPIFNRLAGELDLVVRRWAIKVKKLGLRPTGLWIVDFDAPEGWFTWRLGDEHVSHFSAPSGELTSISEEKGLHE